MSGILHNVMRSTFFSLTKQITPEWVRVKIAENFKREGLERYIKSTSWMLFARIFNTIIGFLVGIYVIRSLGPESYGQLSYAVSLVSFFAIIAALGIDGILSRDLVSHPESRNVYLGTAFTIKFVMGVIATIATIVTSYFFVADDVSKIIIYFLAPTFIFISFHIIIYEFNARVEQKYVSLILIFVTTLLNILKILVIYSGNGVLFIAGILLLEAIIYAGLYVITRTIHYGSLTQWKYDNTIARKMLFDSWPFIFISISAIIYTRIDQIMLKHLIDATAVGLYDAAVRIAEAWLIIPTVVVSSLFPAIVNARLTNYSEYKKRLILLSFGAGISTLVVTLVLTTFSSIIMTSLYGQTFAASSAVFVIYMWGTIFASIGTVLYFFLIAENMRLILFLTSAASAGLNVVLNMYLIPTYGIAGAAWATLLSYSILTLPLFFIIRLPSK